MFTSKAKQKEKFLNSMGNCRVKRLLQEMKNEAIDLPCEGLEVVICNDGAVLFDVGKDGAGVMLIERFRTIPFSLNLTPEEMREFNGGAGLQARFMGYKE